jgi:hypothetical protein
MIFPYFPSKAFIDREFPIAMIDDQRLLMDKIASTSKTLPSSVFALPFTVEGRERCQKS